MNDLFKAVKNRDHEKVETLCANQNIGILAAQRDRYGMTALDIAIQEGHVKMVRALLKCQEVRQDAMQRVLKDCDVVLLRKMVDSMLLTKPLINEMITMKQLNHLKDPTNIKKQIMASFIKVAMFFQEHYGFSELDNRQLLSLEMRENIFKKRTDIKQFAIDLGKLKHILFCAPIEDTRLTEEVLDFNDKVDSFIAHLAESNKLEVANNYPASEVTVAYHSTRNNLVTSVEDTQKRNINVVHMTNTAK